jgi:phage shock protein C
MPRHRLTRSATNRRIAGVCGGIAEYFDIDPVLVRVAAVVTIFMGFGGLLYVLLWIALPTSSPAEGAQTTASSAMRIAEERYARGEIDADELERIRQDLTAS